MLVRWLIASSNSLQSLDTNKTFKLQSLYKYLTNRWGVSTSVSESPQLTDWSIDIVDKLVYKIIFMFTMVTVSVLWQEEHYKTRPMRTDLLCAYILQGFLKQRYQGYKLFIIHTHTYHVNHTHLLICTYIVTLMKFWQN